MINVFSTRAIFARSSLRSLLFVTAVLGFLAKVGLVIASEETRNWLDLVKQAREYAAQGDSSKTMSLFNMTLINAPSTAASARLAVDLAKLLTNSVAQANEGETSLATAAALYDQGIGNLPTEEAFEAYNDYGVLLLRLHLAENAIKIFAEGIKFSGNQDASRLASYFYNYGKALERGGRVDDAFTWFCKSLHSDSGLARARRDAFELARLAGTPVEVSQRLGTLVRVLINSGALLAARELLTVTLRDVHLMTYEVAREIALLEVLRYLAATKVGLQEYKTSIRSFLENILKEWSSEASELLWIENIYMAEDLPENLRMPWRDDLQSRGIVAKFLRMVGDDYAVRGHVRHAMERYRLAWRTAGDIESALYLVSFLRENPGVLEDGVQMLEEIIALNEKLGEPAGYSDPDMCTADLMPMERIEDWRNIRNLHVQLGAILEEKRDMPASISQRELALEAHSRLVAIDPFVITQTPVLHEKLGQNYLATGNREMAVVHIREAAKEHRELGEDKAADSSLRFIDHLQREIEGNEHRGNQCEASGSSLQETDRFQTEIQSDVFVVIVNAANPMLEMNVSKVSDIFLKKTECWGEDEQYKDLMMIPEGMVWTPVDQLGDSAIRLEFTRVVHGVEVRSIVNYWTQKLYAGIDTPPPEVASDQDVVVFVRRNPGGIGYVSPATDLGNGVKKVKVLK